MANEIVATEQNAEDYIAYLMGASKGSTEIDEIARDSDPLSMLPVVKIDKNNPNLTLHIGDSMEGSYNRTRRLIMIPLLITEHRTLWPSVESDTFPVCATGHVRSGTLVRDRDHGQGMWRGGDRYDLPQDFKLNQEGRQNCATCPFNQFESAGKWDPRKSTKGKACSEGRTIVFFIIDDGERVSLPNGLSVFNVRKARIAHLNASSTSIKNIKAANQMLLRRGIKPQYSVFEATNEIKGEGTVKWGTLSQDFVGFVGPGFLQTVDEESARLRRLILGQEMDEVIHDFGGPKKIAGPNNNGYQEDDIPF